MKMNTNERRAMRCARNTIIVNAGLSAFKLFAGIFAHSAAMVSDAVHSITDLVSTVVVIIGIKLANRKPDKKHLFGHERFECVAALVLAMLVLTVGIGIGWGGVQRILAWDFEDFALPGLLALIAALVSIGVKEGMYWYIRATAKKIDSGALMADAWHSRADGLASIGSFVGILGARLGLPVMDSVAAIVICLFIVKTAFSIARDAIEKMTDKACDDKIVEEMREVVLAQESVDGVDALRTRLFGNRVYVEVEISVLASASFEQAHGAAQLVHDAIEGQFPKVKHCMVHIKPTSA